MTENIFQIQISRQIEKMHAFFQNQFQIQIKQQGCNGPGEKPGYFFNPENTHLFFVAHKMNQGNYRKSQLKAKHNLTENQ